MRTTTDLRSRNEARCARLLKRSALLDTSGIDWHAVAGTELSDDTLATLVYMRDVEGFTTRYLDGLAGHPRTLGDPLIARFLECWQAEEGAHSRALDRFLASYSCGRRVDIPPLQHAPPSAPPRLERLLVHATRPIGHVVTATHMAWGATNELLTMNGYRLLAERSGHPVLAELLRRIAAQEARHYGFYFLQCEWRLADSRLARLVVPRLLARTWTPVGVGEEFKAPEEFDRILHHLAGDDAGAETIATMDRTITRLPGCSHLRLYDEAARRARVKPAPRPSSAGSLAPAA